MISKLIVHPALAGLDRDEKNSFHGYEYISINKLMHGLSQACTDLGIVLIPSFKNLCLGTVTTKRGSTMYTATVDMQLRIIDVFNDHQVILSSTGYAIDTSNKCVIQAMISAFKYSVMNTLLIATGTKTEAIKIKVPKEPENSLNVALWKVVSSINTQTLKAHKSAKGNAKVDTISKYNLYPMLRNSFGESDLVLYQEHTETEVINLGDKPVMLMNLNFHLWHEPSQTYTAIPWVGFDFLDDDKTANKIVSNAFKDIYRFLSLSSMDDGSDSDAKKNALEQGRANSQPKAQPPKQAAQPQAGPANRPKLLTIKEVEEFTEYLKANGVEVSKLQTPSLSKAIPNQAIIDRIVKAFKNDPDKRAEIMEAAFKNFSWTNATLENLKNSLSQ